MFQFEEYAVNHLVFVTFCSGSVDCVALINEENMVSGADDK